MYLFFLENNKKKTLHHIFILRECNTSKKYIIILLHERYNGVHLYSDLIAGKFLIFRVGLQTHLNFFLSNQIIQVTHMYLC